MGMKNEELKTIKGGGTARRDTKNWWMVEERGVGTGQVGTGSHEN